MENEPVSPVIGPVALVVGLLIIIFRGWLAELFEGSDRKMDAVNRKLPRAASWPKGTARGYRISLAVLGACFVFVGVASLGQTT